MGGTPKRMETFAHFIMSEIAYKLPTGTQLSDISQFSYRYSMYKVSRLSLQIYEFDSVNNDKNQFTCWFRLGQCYVWVMVWEFLRLEYYCMKWSNWCTMPGAEIQHSFVSEHAVELALKVALWLSVQMWLMANFETFLNWYVLICLQFHQLHRCFQCYIRSLFLSLPQPVLGKLIQRPAKLDRKLTHELKSLEDRDDPYDTVIGKTMCADDFYEGNCKHKCTLNISARSIALSQSIN